MLHENTSGITSYFYSVLIPDIEPGKRINRIGSRVNAQEPLEHRQFPEPLGFFISETYLLISRLSTWLSELRKL